ncbi:MAG: LTA synthase family protein [Chitinophagales bacterium]|nr:LTA synthase family protein [Chitinophagales bacterium]
MANNQGKSKWWFPIFVLVFIGLGLLVWRLLFMVHNDVSEPILVLKAAFRLDMSMIAAFFLLLFLPYVGYIFTGSSRLLQLSKGLMISLWLVICSIELSSVVMYHEWGATLDSRAVSYLSNPTEMWASVRQFIPWTVILVGVLISAGGVIVILKFFKAWIYRKPERYASLLVVFLLLPVLLVLLRGGLQKVVITPSDAFFSKDMKQNFAATNKTWYFLYSLKKSGKLQTKGNEEEINRFSQQYQAQRCLESPMDGLWKDKNIVLIVMEGWSADMVSYLYGHEGVAPFFDSLSDQSLRMTEAFSTGFRTDQGLASVMSGVPSMEGANILKKLDKVRSMPSLPHHLKNQGRSTSFVYGGDLNFANLFNYLVALDFDTVVGQQAFKGEFEVSDWGAPDHITAAWASQIMTHQKQPFFSTWLLLSSHAPFDVPIENPFSGAQDIPTKYKASVAYSDYALRLFFESSSKQSWFKNTVFIITSDHGSVHSGWAGNESFERFRIPMIVYDPSTEDPDGQDLQIPCNHFDLPTTILAAVGGSNNDFIFGRNIFCEDTTRIAWWNSDVVQGQYAKQAIQIKALNDPKEAQGDVGLFFDMVKQWFNEL